MMGTMAAWRYARYDIDMREIGIGGYGKAGFRWKAVPQYGMAK
jgi:hypothetical protein